MKLTMKNAKKALWAALLPVVLAGSLLVADDAAAQGKPPLKVGAYVSVTGAASFLGSGEMKTLELYVDMLNKAGGVDGRRVELFAYDDETDAARANTLVKRLLSNDQVHAIIGGSTTGATMSAVPLVERAGIPMLSLAGGSEIVEPIKKNVFKMNHTDLVAVTKLFEHMASQGIKNVGIIAGTDAFGRGALVASQKAAPKKGIKIVREEAFNPKDTDMTTQLVKLRQEPGIQAILNLGFGEPAVMVARSYRQLGLTLPHYGTHALASDSFIKLAGPAAENMIMTNGAILVSDQLAKEDPQGVVVREYVKAYKDKFGEAPSFFAGNAYDALMLIKNAVQTTGSVDPQSLPLADWAYVMETGRIVLSGKGADLLDNVQVREAYLGM